MADNTWKFLEHQESNPEALKQAVDTLIGYTKKKGFAGAENAQLDSLELVKHVIICEAAALVLSDDWQAFMKYRKAGGKEDGENKRIKLKYLRAGQPSGREYTFYTPAPVEVGDIVDIAVVSPDNTSQGMVTAVNVPLEEIEAFKDRAKTIIGKAAQRTEAEEPEQKTLLDV